MVDSEPFGAQLRRRRKALDLTQAELAQLAGCAEITIRKIEADELQPSRQLLARLADQLGVQGAGRNTFLAAGRGRGRRPFNNLSAPPNSLIGRAGELAAVTSALRDEGVRLLTVTGPGGVGKTRLASEAAAALQERFRDGVCLVGLAAISDHRLVIPSIAQALELAAGAVAEAQLREWLRDRELLLVLDNLEQVTDAAPQIAGLLAHAPGLRVLATSRVPLHLSGEHEYALAPLALPVQPTGAEGHAGRGERAGASLAEIVASPAVALFVERARAARAEFALAGASAPVVAEICARLDGLPLAIELAAARVKLLSPPALLSRLAQRLDLLTGGPRDLPERHQTLRSTIAWSYNLLDPAERDLFCRLGVFVGGCSLEAAQAVAGEGAGAPQWELLDGLASLIDKSLLEHRAGTDGADRYAMLETLREYALEQLAAQGRLEELRRSHAQHYLAFVEGAAPQLGGAAQEHWLERLELEHDNLRVALGWSRGPGGDLAAGFRLAEGLWEFWLVRGHVSEGRAWVTSLLALTPEGEVAPARARLLCGGGRLAWAQSDWGQATAMLEASLALCERLADQPCMAAALLHLGQVAEARGEAGRAAELFERSLALFEELGDREGAARALAGCGQIAQTSGDLPRALALLERSLVLFEGLGDRRGAAVALTALGQAVHGRGEYARAEELFERGAALFRALGYRHGVGWALTNQGQSALARGAWGRAEERFAESLALFEELGDQRGYAWAMACLGHAAQERGARGQAVALIERSLALFEELGDQRGYAWALFYAGRAANSGGAHACAAEQLAKSLSIFRRLGDSRYSDECASELDVALAALGQHGNA